jgi:hypothetical protein
MIVVMRVSFLALSGMGLSGEPSPVSKNLSLPGEFSSPAGIFFA